MNVTVLAINLLAAAALVVSFIKDRKKTVAALKAALRLFLRLLPFFVLVILLIGLLFTFLPPEKLSSIIGEQSGFSGVLLTALLGAVLHIPALISFPLAASTLEMGASVTAVAAFITTLTMIGVVTLPIEIRELGKQRALLRNGLSFIGALLISLLMGVIL
jgi:uncharacterized membrane protein YraQ (UPF0718 family)